MNTGKAALADTLAAMFLVAGCCIGGGMLAMPVATGIFGFWPSLVIMAVCWFCMTVTALFLVEASLWMEEGVHIITMTTRLLGNMGRNVSWLLYLFIAYASLVAYTAGAGAQITEWWNAAFTWHISTTGGCLIFLVIFLLIIYLGGHFVGRANTALFILMIGAYVALVGMGIDEMQDSLLNYHNWRGSWAAVPLLLTSFSFQTMVPSLTPLLKSDVRALRVAIIGGTTLAFIVYAIWQALILGIVPVEGEYGLRSALQQGMPATLFLRQHVVGTWVVGIAEFFALFAVATSFLAIGLGLWDFLADGLHLKKIGWNQFLLFLLIAVPVAIFATQFERIFYLALDATGGYGDTIINGIFPALMVWIGRYRLGYKGPWRMPGGKILLVITGALFACALLLEIFMHTGVLSNMQEPSDVLEFHNPELHN